MKPIIKLISMCSDNIENGNIEMSSVAMLNTDEHSRAMDVFHAIWKVYKKNFSIPAINAAMKTIALETGNEFPEECRQEYESLLNAINDSLNGIIFKDAIQKLYR